MNNQLWHAMHDSARTGKALDPSHMPDGWSIQGPRLYLDARILTRFLLLIAVVLALTLIPARSYAMEQEAPAKCNDWFDHHSIQNSPYFSRLLNGIVWAQKKSGTIIAAVYIAECGKYLIGIWRRGGFRTHFLTSWGYVLGQAGNLGKGALTSWNQLLVRSWWLILVPCPGTYMGHKDAWTRPCPTGKVS